MPRDFLIARHKRSFVIRIILRHFIVPCSRRRFRTIFHMQKAIQYKLNRFEVVEVTGFEPATFWSRRALTNSPLSESAILLISPQVFHNSVGLQRRFYAVFRVFSPNFSPNSPPQPVPISAAWPSEK